MAFAVYAMAAGVKGSEMNSSLSVAMLNVVDACYVDFRFD